MMRFFKKKEKKDKETETTPKKDKKDKKEEKKEDIKETLTLRNNLPNNNNDTNSKEEPISLRTNKKKTENKKKINNVLDDWMGTKISKIKTPSKSKRSSLKGGHEEEHHLQKSPRKNSKDVPKDTPPKTPRKSKETKETIPKSPRKSKETKETTSKIPIKTEAPKDTIPTTNENSKENTVKDNSLKDQIPKDLGLRRNSPKEPLNSAPKSSPKDLLTSSPKVSPIIPRLPTSKTSPKTSPKVSPREQLSKISPRMHSRNSPKKEDEKIKNQISAFSGSATLSNHNLSTPKIDDKNKDENNNNSIDEISPSKLDFISPKSFEKQMREKIKRMELSKDFQMEREKTMSKLTFFNTDIMRKQEALETDETRELHQYEPKNNEHLKSYTSPEKIYSNFSNVLQLGRNLGVTTTLKEFVLFGPRANGKSTIIEALLGYPIGGIGYGGKTNCPIIFHLTNNSQCEEPKIVFKKNKNVDFDIKVSSVKQAEYEISTRTIDFSKEPIHIMFEYKYCLDCILIDTPGIPILPPFQNMSEINEIIEYYVSKPERTLIVVEEAIEWESISDSIIQFVKRYDPFFNRTIFVNTKFNSYLQSCNTPRDLLS